MNEARCKGHNITFDVLYYATQTRYAAIVDEIGKKEGEYIRQYQPVLNTQIPKAEDWNKYDVRDVDARQILNDIL